MIAFTGIFTAMTASVLMSVMAYIGPGTGLSAIGTLLAVIAAVILALVGFVWYPLKRLVNKFKNQSRDAE